MKITPRSEQEFQSRGLLQPGIYDYEVFDSIEKLSKNSGEPMIEIILKIVDQNNRTYKIFDYLMDREPMDYKIRRLCEAHGLLDRYESGEIESDDFLHKKGKVKINIRKDKTGQYGDRNAVQEYLLKDSKQQEIPLFNDEVPF